MILIFYAIILLVYLACPQYVKLVVFIINIFLPDPIPFVDEFLMLVGFFVR